MRRDNFSTVRVGAYCIRPTGCHPKDGKCAKRGTFSRCNDLIIRKRVTFSISIMYPASFPGLGRGLDFLLPSFLVSRQEKKVEVLEIRPIEHHPKNGECTKRDTFLGHKDLIIPKRGTFLGYSFHKWNVCRAYAIRPYLVTQKHGTFSIPHAYPVNFPGLGRGLDFLLPSFLVSRQEKKVGAWGRSPQCRASF